MGNPIKSSPREFQKKKKKPRMGGEKGGGGCIRDEKRITSPFLTSPDWPEGLRLNLVGSTGDWVHKKKLAQTARALKARAEPNVSAGSRKHAGEGSPRCAGLPRPSRRGG